MNIILKYFPNLTGSQIDQFDSLDRVYKEWNQKINLISRKDINSLYTKHILHSLSIAKCIQFSEGTKILDIGTGGGFPGIPLAILFPYCSFYLIDSIAKKITAVKAIAKSLGLNNVKANQIRAEKLNEKFDFIVSRAVAPTPTLLNYAQGKVFTHQRNILKNGLLCLKGGELTNELRALKKVRVFQLSSCFEEPFFETKKMVHIEM